jgi:hypothetical protein
LIQAFLDLSAATQFILLAVIYCIWAVVLHGMTMRWRTKVHFVRFRGVVGPFMGAVGLLFGLLTGFLAHDVGSRRHAALEAVQTEATSLHTLYAISLAMPGDQAVMRSAIQALLKSELDDEWPRMMERSLSPSTHLAYRKLFQEIAAPSIAAAGSAIQSTMFNTALRASQARSQRITLAFDRGDDAKWTCVLLLALLTQFTVALVLMQDRWEPQAISLALFTIASILALSLIAFQEEPFAGPLRILPTPLEEVLHAIGTGGPA